MKLPIQISRPSAGNIRPRTHAAGCRSGAAYSPSQRDSIGPMPSRNCRRRASPSIAPNFQVAGEQALPGIGAAITQRCPNRRFAACSPRIKKTFGGCNARRGYVVETLRWAESITARHGQPCYAQADNYPFAIDTRRLPDNSGSTFDLASTMRVIPWRSARNTGIWAEAFSIRMINRRRSAPACRRYPSPISSDPGARGRHVRRECTQAQAPPLAARIHRGPKPWRLIITGSGRR